MLSSFMLGFDWILFHSTADTKQTQMKGVWVTVGEVFFSIILFSGEENFSILFLPQIQEKFFLRLAGRHRQQL